MADQTLFYNDPHSLKASFQDVVTASSMSTWTLTGRHAVVKVVSIDEASAKARRGCVCGYVTQAKYLKGLNAFEIERDLGLRPCSSNRGLIVFYFKRLPRMGEVEQRYAAAWPDGRPWTEERFNAFMAARERRLASTSDIVEDYPPGSTRILQWQLMKPVPLSRHYKIVMPNLPFFFE